MKPHSLRDPKPITNTSKVPLNLLTHAVLSAPVWIQREAVGIEMRRDVAAAAGIRVGEPCAADIVGFLNELEVPDAEVADDLYGEPEAGHAGANYEDFGVEGHDVVIVGRVLSWTEVVRIARNKTERLQEQWNKTTIRLSVEKETGRR